MYCRRWISRWRYALRLAVATSLVSWLIFHRQPATDESNRQEETYRSNKYAVAETSTRQKETNWSNKYAMAENEGVYWGNYYRNKIREIGVKPYQFHMNTSCKGRFYDNLEENFQTVLNYPVIKKMENKYSEIFNEFKKDVVNDTSTGRFPVIVTGASSNHYSESLRMIRSVKEIMMPRYKGLKLIFFDLGLRKQQRDQLKTFCNCEIRDFPFQDYPRFVSNLMNYVWKPLIIYTMLKEYNFITWADSSVVFQGSKNASDNFFKRAKEVGLLVNKLGCECRSFQHTKAETFSYLNETTCLFELFQLEAGFFTIWKTTFTWKYVIQPWLACALTENCMSHPNPRALLYCYKRKPFHKCHRFDQSVLSIILQRIFNVYYDLVTMNKLERIAKIVRRFL